MKNPIIIETIVHIPIDKVWNYWNAPEHITKWNQASPDWHAPKAENDLRVGGKFTTTMAARDGSMQFDFLGIYVEVKPTEWIAYTMGDGRKATITFSIVGETTKITQRFEPESANSIKLQQAGWQAILNSFKSYTENN
jgi:uncharacterized protein YndB with AHSA1/START domain